MTLEVIAAVLVGAAAVWLVLQPLVAPGPPSAPVVEPLDPEETPKGIALTALKEIEFDRETGKLSQADYELLKGKYTAAALEALRQETEAGSGDVEAIVAAKVRALRFASAATSPNPSSVRPDSGPACATCGPRPEPDAIFCSTCGHRISPGLACDRCGAALAPGSKFCEACGRQVAA